MSSSEAWQRRLESLRELQTTARDAAERIATALGAGEPPPDADLAVIAGFRDALASAMRELLPDQPSADPSVDAIEAAVAERQLAWELDRLVEGLRRLSDLPGDGPVAYLYAHVKERALTLLKSDPRSWREDEVEVARALDALVATADASATRSEQPPVSLQEYPADFRAALGLAAVGALPLPRSAGGLVLDAESRRAADKRGPASAAPSGAERAAESAKATDTELSATAAPLAASASEFSHGGTELSTGSPVTETDEPVSTDEDAASDEAEQSGAADVGDGSVVVSPVEPQPAPAVAAEAALTQPADMAGGGDLSEAEADEGAPNAGDKTAPAPVDEAGVEVVAEEAFAGALRGRRIGLAYWIARTSSRSQAEILLLEAAAYADQLRAPAGACAGALRRVLTDEFEVSEVRESHLTRYLAVAAGVPGALFSPYSGAAQILKEVAPTFGETPELAEVLQAVVECAERGVQIEPEAVRHVRDVASLERELADLQERARDLRQPRKLVFARASDVWRHWTADDGVLGALLVAVEADDVDRAVDVQRQVVELRNPKQLDHLIDETDRAYRRPSVRGVIEARARQSLISRAVEALDLAAEWASLVGERSAGANAASSASWQTQPLDAVRAVARAHQHRIREFFDEAERADGLDGAVARATRQILEDMLGLVVDGRPLRGIELAPELALSRDLLRVPEIELGPALEPVAEVSLPLLFKAFDDPPWSDVFAERSARGDHDATQRLIELVAYDDADLAARLGEQRERELGDQRARLTRLKEGARARLDSARMQGQLDEAEWGTLYARLDAVDASGASNLRRANAELDAIVASIDAQRERAVAREAARFRKLKIKDPVSRRRIEALLADGDLATAEELVLAIERGVELPQPDAAPLVLEAFFPTFLSEVLQVWPKPQGRLAAAARSGSAADPLDFEKVTEPRREAVARGLEAWLALASNDRSDLRAKLTSVLELIGLPPTQLQLHDESGRKSPRMTRRRRCDIVARPSGKALVPTFGSEAQGRYRVVAAWDPLDADALADLADQDAKDAPLIVLSLQIISAETRNAIADQLRSSHRRPLALIDTTALLFIAQAGGGFETTMRVTLPFGGINPYRPFVAGRVPAEMFYGRKQELELILDPSGTSFIYGGRQLGKSALLRAAEREFVDRGPEREAVYLDLKNQGIGSWRPASDLHELLAQTFRDRGLAVRTSKETEDELYSQLSSTFEQNPNLRLLLLLDEADDFLDADAQDGFRAVRRLKELMDTTDRRFKPVLAGLHEVQRFQAIPNQPLAHLGAPISIGPLTPQYAYNLVVGPMKALGYAFPSDEPVLRILTNTNYQPSLIQLLCNELVNDLLNRQTSPGQPPYPVTLADVERVYSTPRVSDGIRQRFELTINLDPRYRVIAYVLALEGVDARLSARAIMDRCDEWWAAGFHNTSDDEFRALLSELCGLGILHNEDETYGFRSPNVLRMLGTQEQIEEKLIAVCESEPPVAYEAGSFRTARDSDPHRRSPLTEQQVADVFRRQPQVRVVLGSSATLVEDVAPALEHRSAGGDAQALDVRVASPQVVHFRKLLSRSAQGKHRIALTDARTVDGAAAAALIQAASDVIHDGGSPSGAIIVLSPLSLSFWRSLFDEGVSPAGVHSVPLRRWTHAGLRFWAQAPDVDVPFHSPESIDAVIAATSGWPYLVQRLVDDYHQGHDAAAALRRLAEHVASDQGAAELVESFGLAEDDRLRSAWATLLDYSEPLARHDLLELLIAEGCDASDFSVLRSLQLLDQTTGGDLRAEPLAAAAWASVHGSRS